MDPSLDARGSERSLQIALADPAEGSDDVADDLDDSALVERRRHGRGEAARTRFDWLLAVPVRALPLYADSGDRNRPSVSRRCRGSPVQTLRDSCAPVQPQQSQSLN